MKSICERTGESLSLKHPLAGRASRSYGWVSYQNPGGGENLRFLATRVGQRRMAPASVTLIACFIYRAQQLPGTHCARKNANRGE